MEPLTMIALSAAGLRLTIGIVRRAAGTRYWYSNCQTGFRRYSQAAAHVRDNPKCKSWLGSSITRNIWVNTEKD